MQLHERAADYSGNDFLNSTRRRKHHGGANFSFVFEHFPVLIALDLDQVGVPYFFAGQREKAEMKGSTRPLSEIERNFIQDEYHVMLGPFEDYAEMCIQVSNKRTAYLFNIFLMVASSFE